MPQKYLPNRELLAYHHEKVFMGVLIYKTVAGKQLTV